MKITMTEKCVCGAEFSGEAEDQLAVGTLRVRHSQWKDDHAQCGDRGKQEQFPQLTPDPMFPGLSPTATRAVIEWIKQNASALEELFNPQSSGTVTLPNPGPFPPGETTLPYTYTTTTTSGTTGITGWQASVTGTAIVPSQTWEQAVGGAARAMTTKELEEMRELQEKRWRELQENRWAEMKRRQRGRKKKKLNSA